MKLDLLLKKFRSADEVEYLEGDLDELYQKRAAEVGRIRARCLYVRDAFSLCWRGFIEQMKEGKVLNLQLNHSQNRLAASIPKAAHTLGH